ncbi:signal transduction histidine kinase [Marmoricola sp. OAE513]|uniref:ATP-binding protein n=1 Tax=Marmoricola sp. OAE513 TaxID=2817894 RepID=UPI001AE6620F
MAGANEGATTPTERRRRHGSARDLGFRLAFWSISFLVAGYIGRATVIDGRGLSLIWPAIGIAAMWLGTAERRTLPVDLVVLSACMMLVNLTTGAPLVPAALFLLTNLLQVAVFVALVRRWIPDLWGFGGTGQLHRIVDLARIAVAAAISGAASTAFAIPAISVALGAPHPVSVAVWWGRNTVALVVISTLMMLTCQPLVASGSIRAAAEAVREALSPQSPGRLAEVCGLIGASVALSLLIFADRTAEPLAFLLLVTSVWAGLRFASLAVTVHGVAMGAVGMFFTLADRGPFAAIDDLHYRALVAQGFVLMTVLTGLALAFSRAERDAAARELVRARRAADERAQLLNAVLESLKEGVVVVESDGHVLVHNSASRDLAGLVGSASEQVRPASEYGLFHPNGLPLREDEMANARALAGEVVEPFDLHVRTPSVPQGRILEVSGRPLLSEPGAPRRAMVNLRDVTVDRQHRDALSSFAGVVAHDLVNPLSIVDGWTEALADEFRTGSVSPAVGALMVERIQDSTRHMREFIADLMSYTIARDQSLRSGPVDLTATVRSLADLRTSSPAAPVIAVADGLQVWADAGLVRQLLDNLIGNAVKYVAPGVRPVVEVSGQTVGDWLEVRVADNGIGIPEAQREAVFETFHRAHGEGYHGTGLGLAICRRIVDRHGGSIHVAPGARGTGTTIVFRLPLVAAVEEQPFVGSQAAPPADS